MLIRIHENQKLIDLILWVMSEMYVAVHSGHETLILTISQE